MGPVRAFHDAAPGLLVWFRDLRGRYYLARLVGDWRLLHGKRAERLDLANVRQVEYAAVGSETDVPGAVIRAYGVPRQLTFCRINDYGAQAYSAQLASELLTGQPPDVDLSTDAILRSLLAPLDVEDLVVAYLQDRRGYVAFPVRQGRSTAVYECVLRNRKDGHTAVIQVKTGGAEVPIKRLTRAWPISGSSTWIVSRSCLRSYTESRGRRSLSTWRAAHCRFPSLPSAGCAGKRKQRAAPSSLTTLRHVMARPARRRLGNRHARLRPHEWIRRPEWSPAQLATLLDWAKRGSAARVRRATRAEDCAVSIRAAFWLRAPHPTMQQTEAYGPRPDGRYELELAWRASCVERLIALYHPSSQGFALLVERTAD